MQALRTGVWQDGIRATFRGEKLVKYAEKFLELAEGGLERRGIKNKDGTKDERMHLARLRELVTHGECPADRLLASMKGDPKREILERADLTPA